MDHWEHFRRLHVLGAPVYVLDPKLQDGKKIPKWEPRSRLGMYLGFSSKHSSLVSNVLNIWTGSVSPQYHVVINDLFTTVPNVQCGGLYDLESFDATRWESLIETRLEFHLDHQEALVNGNRRNRRHGPTLGREWLTGAK